MNQETITYLTNIVLSAILAALATHYWRQHRGAPGMVYWVVAAWVMTAADVLFAARPTLAPTLARFLPTIMVTVGHAVLFLGAQRSAALKRSWRTVACVAGLHAVALIGFLVMAQPSSWRMVVNGFIWGGFSIASALCLRRGAKQFWQSIAAPATVFFAHGVFHALRVGLAILFAAKGWTEASAWLQLVGDLEVSFFMVALFVGLLIAHLQLRHDELMSAHAEVQTLSGLLPICAWCKKVRDDNGYWEQVEDYFSNRSRIRFTHGMCVECVDKMKEPAEATTPVAP
ncbi:hypothetical protein [Oleiharenicola lentus]|uniref:hypothetical protein n=1 Tax=Oleiharenicola lentus TaxID=2508720 RepID=UPI003F67D60A